MDYIEWFHNRVAELRIQKGVSARDTSLSLGQSESYINKIENTYKYLLVSSDGLHGYVEKKVISDIVHDSSLSLQEKTETLIARANQ